MSSLGGRTLSAEDKRDRLLDVAEAAFCAHGYDGTTIAVLAAEAGVTRPTVYAYFASKDDVFRAVADRVRREFLWLQERADTSSPERTAREAVAGYLAAWARHHGMLTVIAHQALADPGVRTLRDEILARAERRNTRFVERLTAEGLADPALPPADLSRAVTGIVARAAEVVADDPRQLATLARRIGDAYLRLAGIAAA
ncbi:MAG: TetR/AcrR family transcriptional regulator [Pseudonocardia sp.]|uniref:TetR/AcrR family transcriptional regulator n=1 Tax=Pseudonocardia sp. TaxID=60912 RepID=UPI001AC69FB4|nr:TetR/AcrR family transcriptional regulator [Pseudonocardia sp.]MBN9099908.1 TetR/AcrR family transcriptional regulator [Pseudonocardia sp.]